MLIDYSASQLAQMIRKKEVSSVEVAQAFIDRIEVVSPKINALCEHYPEKVLAEAKQADAALAQGEAVGALHGVPISIKNAVNLAGYRHDRGSYGWPQAPRTEDATVIKRLKAAGAVILGTTNVPEMLVAYETDNLIYGRTNNPYDLNRTPGGSSGGESALIAAGGSPLGLGSDAAGSLREPSHCTGISTLRPTNRRIPLCGESDHHVVGLLRDVATIGPMSRHIEDCDLMLDLIAGPDGQDAFVVPVPLEKSSTVALDRLRVGYYTQGHRVKTQDEIVTGVERVVAALRSTVVSADEVVLPFLDGVGNLLWETIFAGGSNAHNLRRFIADLPPEKISPILQWVLDGAESIVFEVAGLHDRICQMNRIRNAFARMMQDIDIVISPVQATTALQHGASFELTRLLDCQFAQYYSVIGNPVAVIPVGRDADGLPFGIQIAGRPFEDHVVLAVAQHLQTVFPPFAIHCVSV